jgi:hypothetical protein
MSKKSKNDQVNENPRILMNIFTRVKSKIHTENRQSLTIRNYQMMSSGYESNS